MAAGRLSPRQRMINMMYLVLMAMLALNVSKEVLIAFGNINESINSTTKQLTSNSELIFNDLKQKNETNPEKYNAIFANASKVKSDADLLVNYLDELSLKFEATAGGRDEEGKLPWKEMDMGTSDEILFPAGDPNSGEGQELQDRISNFRELILGLPVEEDVKNQVRVALNTDNVKHEDGLSVQWVKDKFEHYPLAASLTFLSQIKADIRNAESNVLSSLVKTGLGEQIVVNAMKALTVSASSTVLKGSSFEANVILAAYDSTLIPEIYLYEFDRNGKRIGNSERKVNNDGSGLVKIPANSTGEFYWGGVLKVKKDDGEIKPYEFKSRYNVNEAAAVISPDKMNILYRGVDNPISISVPGVASNKISATGPGLTRNGNQWVANVTNFKGYEGQIEVVAEMPDGTKQRFPGKTYRIKDIPMPQGQIAGETDIKLPVANLIKIPIEAKIPDFEFDLKLNVVSFDLKIAGRPTVTVTGNRLDGKATDMVRKLSKGMEVIIRNIKVQLPDNTSYKIAKVSPIVVTID